MGTSAAFTASFNHCGEDITPHSKTGTTKRTGGLLVHAKNCKDLSLLVRVKCMVSNREGIAQK